MNKAKLERNRLRRNNNKKSPEGALNYEAFITIAGNKIAGQVTEVYKDTLFKLYLKIMKKLIRSSKSGVPLKLEDQRELVYFYNLLNGKYDTGSIV